MLLLYHQNSSEQCHFLPHRSNMTHPGISVCDSLRTAPVKHHPCRRHDPWPVRSAWPASCRTGGSMGTRYQRTIQPLRRITWFSVSFTAAAQHPGWRVYGEIDTKAGMVGFGSGIDTDTKERKHAFLFVQPCFHVSSAWVFVRQCFWSSVFLLCHVWSI